MRLAKAANWTASVWLPLGFALTIPAYLWHQNYFRSTGTYFLLIRGLPLLCVIALLYARWLRPAVRRYEFPLLVLFPVVICCAVRPTGVLSVAAIASAALVLGDLWTPVLRFNEEDAPVVWACGFGMLILLGAALGKLGVLSLPTVMGMLALCLLRAIFIWRRLLHWLAGPFAIWNAAKDLTSPAVGVSLFFLFLFTACSLLLALTPVTAFDVVSYHFPLARYYAQWHAIQPTTWIVQSFYPQGAEVLMAIGFLLGGESAASLLMPFLGVLFLWLLVRVGRMCGLSPSAVVMGAAIAATFPFLQWTLSVPKNDSAMSLFLLAALYSFLRWQAGRGTRWLLLLAFFLGQTSGIKHVALIGLLAMAPLCLFAWWREKCSLPIVFAAILLFAATGLFWHVQTWVLKGDPTYPAHLIQAVHTPNQEHGNHIVRAAIRYSTLPWYLLFKGDKAFESASPNPLGMFCFVFLPVAAIRLWQARWTPARQACLCFILIYFLYWSSILSTLRYAIVPFSLVALGLGAALVNLLEGWRGIKRTALLALLSYCLLFSLLVFLSIAVNSSQAAFLSGRISKEEFLSQVTPATRPLFRLAALAPGASAFGIDVCGRYYAPDPLHFSCILSAEHHAPADVTAQLETGFFQYAILPSGSEFQALKDEIVSTLGAAMIDNDGLFTILRMQPQQSHP